MLTIFLFCVLVSGVVGVFHTSCEDGWVADEGYCYWFGDDATHFTEAEHYCKQHQSHLVQVYTAAENAFVRDQLRKRVAKAVCHWMGLTDEMTEGIWRWSTGSKEVANFTDWHPSQPGRDGEEDCGIFWQAFDYQWGDVQCSNNCMAVCKQKYSIPKRFWSKSGGFKDL